MNKYQITTECGDVSSFTAVSLSSATQFFKDEVTRNKPRFASLFKCPRHNFDKPQMHFSAGKFQYSIHD